MTPNSVEFGRHARLPVDWVTGLKPAGQADTLQGWVKEYYQALNQAYQLQRAVPINAGAGRGTLQMQSKEGPSASWRACINP